MFKRLYIIGFFSCLLFFSCSYHGFYFDNKRNHQAKESYSNDTLFLSDYILFGTYSQKRLNYGIVRLKSDSLFTIFEKSIKKTQLPISINNNRNVSNKRIIDKYHSRAKHIKAENIKVYTKASKMGNSKRVIIPVIKFNFNTDNHCSDAGCDTYYVVHLSLAIFILENNEVIYYKKMRHEEKLDDDNIPDYYNYYNVPIPKEKWDKLVLDVMKEYIERLE